MKTYTSYFSQTKKFKDQGIYPVSISYGEPPNYEYKNKYDEYFKMFAPPYSISKEYKETGNWMKYIKEYYRQVLFDKDPKEFLKVLERVAEEQKSDIALVCWEGFEKNCHRHIIADWLNLCLDYKIEEWIADYQKENREGFKKYNIYTLENAGELKYGDKVLYGDSERDLETIFKGKYDGNIGTIMYVDKSNKEEPFCVEINNNGSGGMYKVVYLLERGNCLEALKYNYD